MAGFCSNCGAKIVPGSRFCENCGAPVEEPAEVKDQFCPNCGAKIIPGSRFCESCGTPVAAGEVPADSGESFAQDPFAQNPFGGSSARQDGETPGERRRRAEDAGSRTAGGPGSGRASGSPRNAASGKKSQAPRPSAEERGGRSSGGKGKLIGILVAVAAAVIAIIVIRDKIEQKRYEQYRKEQEELWEQLQQEKPDAQTQAVEDWLKGDESDVMPSEPSSSEPSESPAQPSGEASSVEDWLKGEELSEPEDSAGDSYEPAPAEEVTEGAAVRTDEHGYYLPSAAAEAVSTEAVPALDEFDWFLEGVLMNGVPDSAENIHSATDVVGSWKCLVVYDPQNKEGKLGYHLGTMNIGCRESEGKDFLGPYIIWNTLDDGNGNKQDESGKGEFLSVGYFDDGWYGEGGQGNMSLKFWTTGDGKQYAWGSAKFQDVGDNIVVLVRP